MTVHQPFLDSPVTVLPGIGPRRAKTLAKLDLHTVRDVLFSFPRAYKDFTRVFRPDEVDDGKEQLVHGDLVDLTERSISGGRRLIQGRLFGANSYLNLTWFVVHKGRGSSYLFRRLQKADKLWVYGLVKTGLWGPEMTSAEFFHRPPGHLGLVPIYPLVASISNEMRVSWVKAALQHLEDIDEILPNWLLDQYVGRRVALKEIHFPKNAESLERARQRLVFEEFFLFHLGLQSGTNRQLGVQHGPDGQLVKHYFKRLPFELTDHQKQAIDDVRCDMEAPYQMRRLIQGEVGSGKTIVAEYAAVKAVDSRGQAAVMVPTEVLARQMAERFKEALTPLGISVGLLVGNMTTKSQEETRQRIQLGELDVIVGTHALITDKVQFLNLTLAIIDEQHRFGVRQRLALTDKGNVDLLVMSATPIPRSLALTAYGDLDTTAIRQLPAGRQKVETYLINPRQRNDVYRFVTKRVSLGEQAFVVFPLVEESEQLDLKAAVQEMENLKEGPLRTVQVGLVHGQMGKEKEEVLNAFYRQEIDVLIATTVIEVGMNIPNATVMVIENAERFGLAQLHQLRGRVGRGEKQGHCFLIPYTMSETVKERLNVIRNSNDGFEIAEADLKIRGPGDLLGVRQSGQPLFRIGDIVDDRDLLAAAAEEAKKLLEINPSLNQYSSLQQELNRQRPSS